MSRIVEIVGREIIDSRGNPTVEADVILDSGVMGRAAVPSGASTGTREAVELRDGDKKRYLGKGVKRAVASVNTVLKAALLGKDANDQETLDDTMIQLDGTDNKGNLGANALLAISLANARAAAADNKQSLWKYIAKGREPVMPVPMMNVINGGAHADNSLDVQEFMIIPAGAPSFSEALRYGAEIFHTLKGILKKKKLTTAVGDEGGFAPNLSSNEAGIKVIIQAIEQAGYKLGKQIYLGMDVASSEFYKKGKYDMHGEGRKFTSPDYVKYLAKLAAKYPIVSIEDGMAEQDWVGWKNLTDTLDIFASLDFTENGNVYRDAANTDGDTEPYYLFPTTNAKNGGFALHNNSATKYVVPTGSYEYFERLKAAAIVGVLVAGLVSTVVLWWHGGSLGLLEVYPALGRVPLLRRVFGRSTT